MNQFSSSFAQSAIDQEHNYLNDHFNKDTMSFSLVYPDRFIQVSDGIFLHVKNIILVNSKYQANAMVQYQNGYPLLVPIQYRSVFEEIFVSTQKIAYKLKSYTDNFAICLKLHLKPSNSNDGFDDQEEQLIQQALVKLRQSLIFIGLIKCRNRLSLQIIKHSLKLKKIFNSTILNNPVPHVPGQDITGVKIQDKAPIKMEVEQKKQHNVQQIQYIKQVTDMVEEKSQKNGKNGGYFCVQKRYYDIVYQDGSQRKNQRLAFKRMRSAKSREYKEKGKKQRELEIVKKIHKNKYMVNYYALPNTPRPFYMDYIEKSLKEVVYEEKLKINQLFSITKQIVEAVQIVHKSEIVHRDLKLQNIMIEQKDGKKNIKLIDFGESAQMGLPYLTKHNLGCTLPYSPIQCLFDSAEGYNKPEIDFWSLIMVIYEISFKVTPIYYNRNIQAQIMSGWKTQGDFNPVLNTRPKNGIRKIEEVFALMTEAGLKIKQSQRLRLKTVYQIVQGIQNFYNELTTFIKNH